MPRLASNLDAAMLGRSGAATRLNNLVKDKFSLFNDVYKNGVDWYNGQSKVRKVLLQVLAVVGLVAMVLLLIFHRYVIHLLVYLSDQWLELRFGRLLLFTLIFFVGFPPLIGFSALSMLSGMVYGFPYGWPLLASASISGSLCSFLVFRYLLHKQAVKLINHNEKFRAFSEILKEDSSLFLLVLLRLCPLPYSLSNGSLAAIPELPVLTYFLASLITSPKLMIHVFVGHKLKDLGDENKPKSAKVIDILSIVITALAAFATTYIIYHRMQDKLAIYHNANGSGGASVEDHDRMIFGNFEDDLEAGQNVELDESQFDADNFIIEDEDDERPALPSKVTKDPFASHNNVEDFDLEDDLEQYGGKLKGSSTNRNYWTILYYSDISYKYIITHIVH